MSWQEDVGNQPTNEMNVIPLAILGVKWPFSKGCGSTFTFLPAQLKKAILHLSRVPGTF